MQAFHTSPVRKDILDSPQFDFINSKFMGWPMYREIGGKTMWDKLDEVDPEQVRLRVSSEDLHPNGEGHEYMAEIFYNKYRKIYN